jgi:threonine synthase
MTRASLGEGNTPLVPSVFAGPSLGLSRLYFKLENCNPSGSYKDRFIAAEVGRMLGAGARACVATSSGNTGSALAAYCARYGIRCAIVVNDTAPAGKLEQMRAHGATVFRVPEFVTSAEVTRQVLDTLGELARRHKLPLVVSAYRHCPEGMAGVESIARELVHQTPQPPDHVFVPVGGGGLCAAVCRGFQSIPGNRTRVHAVQPEGCRTVVAALERGDSEIRPLTSTTAISGLSVPFDIDAGLALHCLREREGTGLSVTDEEVYEAQRLLLGKEGIYAEPAGATALAGLMRAVRNGGPAGDECVVCLVTGHGFKDPASVREIASRSPAPLVEAGGLAAAILEITRP